MIVQSIGQLQYFETHFLKSINRRGPLVCMYISVQSDKFRLIYICVATRSISVKFHKDSFKNERLICIKTDEQTNIRTQGQRTG